MIQKGYIVFDVDIRGTSGYGKKFRTDIHKKVGCGLDLSDLISGVEFLRSLGYVDPERVGVYGGSGGGFMTLMALCLKPDYFTCGAALRSLTDWKNYHSSFCHHVMGRPQDNPEGYKESSPITHAEKLKRPLLLIHGMIDANSFSQESIKFAERLIQAGIDFEFMLYPTERHSFSDPECWIDEYRRIERFMDKHLLKSK
jgi:dipeptidyl aminopeptidase/acylaminoacyl peptidase